MANLYFEATLDAEKLKEELRTTGERVKNFGKEAETEGGKVQKSFDGIGAAAKKGGSEISQNIAIQKKVIAGLQKELIPLEAAFKKANFSTVDPKALAERKRLSAIVKQMKADLEGEQKALTMLEQRSEGAAKGMVSLRTQMMNTRNEMGALRLAGKENTDQYRELEKQLGTLGTAYRELRTIEQAVSTGGTQLAGFMDGLNALSGTIATGVGALSLFNNDSEKMAEIQTRLQGIMAMSIGLMQVSNALHSTSAFRITTVNRVKELWAAANLKVATTLGISNLAAQALMATLTLGLSVAITAAILLFSKFSKRQKAAAEETKKFNAIVSDMAAEQLDKFGKLKVAYERLNGNIEAQTKLVKESKGEFEDLGLAIDGVNDAERLFSTEGTIEFENAVFDRAKALSVMELAAEKHKAIVEKLLLFDDMGDTVRKYDAGSGRAGDGTSGWYTAENEKKKKLEEEIEKDKEAWRSLVERGLDYQKEADKFFGRQGAGKDGKGGKVGVSFIDLLKKDLTDHKKAYEEYNTALRTARNKDKQGVANYYRDLTKQGEDYEAYLNRQLETFKNNTESKVAIYQAAANANIDFETDRPLKIEGIKTIPTLEVDTSKLDIKKISIPQSEFDKWDKLREKIEAALKIERLELFGEAMISIAWEAQELAAEIGKIDASMGSLFMGIADGIGQVGNISKAVASDDMMGAMSSGLSGALQLTGMLVNASKERKAEEEAFYSSILRQQQLYNLSLNESLRLQSELNESIFLVDYQGRMSDATNAYENATKSYLELEKKLGAGRAITGKRNAVDWGNVGKGAAGGAAAGAAIGSVVPVIGTVIGGAVGAIGGAIAGIFGGKKKKDKYGDLLREYPELIDQSKEGVERFNVELAESLIASNLVDDATKENLTGLIEWTEQAKEAKEQIRQISKDLVGAMGSDLKNALVNAFKDGTDAAEEFGKSVDKMLENMIADFIIAAVFGDMLKQFEENFADAYAEGGVDAVIPLLGQLLKGVDRSKGDAEFLMQEAKDYAEKHGMSVFSPNADNDASLTGAIKGVSEQTASLIGGQMNAIRINQTESLKAINDVARYTAQIAINTAYNHHLQDIAKNTAHLKSNDLKAKGL